MGIVDVFTTSAAVCDSCVSISTSLLVSSSDISSSDVKLFVCFCWSSFLVTDSFLVLGLPLALDPKGVVCLEEQAEPLALCTCALESFFSSDFISLSCADFCF